MKFHERIFRAVCKASVYILISAFCVGTVGAVYYVFKYMPEFAIFVLAITLAMVLLLNGWFYINEDWKKREEQLNKEIEQLEREMKQHSDEVKKE